MIVRRNRNAEEWEARYHIAAWGIPAVFVLFLAGFQQYGNRGGFCYMEAGLPVFVAFFLPGLVVVSANSVIFFFIAKEIHETLKSAPVADRKEQRKEARVYFSIFASIGLSWIFGFVMTFTGGVLYAILLVLFSITTPLQGFMIFISYCLNMKVFYRWASFLGICIPFFRRFESRPSAGSSVTSSTSSTYSSDRSGRSGRSKPGNSNSSIIADPEASGGGSSSVGFESSSTVDDV